MAQKEWQSVKMKKNEKQFSAKVKNGRFNQKKSRI